MNVSTCADIANGCNADCTKKGAYTGESSGTASSGTQREVTIAQKLPSQIAQASVVDRLTAKGAVLTKISAGTSGFGASETTSTLRFRTIDEYLKTESQNTASAAASAKVGKTIAVAAADAATVGKTVVVVAGVAVGALLLSKLLKG